MRLLDGVANWSGPQQVLFLEWAWNFMVNLNGARRGLGRAARWANVAQHLDTPIKDRNRADFPDDINFETASSDLFYVLNRKLSGCTKAQDLMRSMKDPDAYPL